MYQSSLDIKSNSQINISYGTVTNILFILHGDRKSSIERGCRQNVILYFQTI